MAQFLIILSIAVPAKGWLSISPDGYLTMLEDTFIGDWGSATAADKKDLRITGAWCSPFSCFLQRLLFAKSLVNLLYFCYVVRCVICYAVCYLAAAGSR